MQPTRDDITCFNIAMTLNNIAVSLVDKRCHAKAIEVFCDALALLKSGHPSGDVACTFVSKANQFIACCQQYQVVRVPHAGTGTAPCIVSDEDLITVAQYELEEHAMEICTANPPPPPPRTPHVPFNCYLVQFAGSFDFASNMYFVDVVVATVLNNMACAYISANIRQSKLDGALAGAHELWALSLSSVDSFLYNDAITDNYMKMQQRAMQILVLRCVQETAGAMQLEEVASAFNAALLEECRTFRDMQIVKSIPRTRLSAAAAA